MSLCCSLHPRLSGLGWGTCCSSFLLPSSPLFLFFPLFSFELFLSLLVHSFFLFSFTHFLTLSLESWNCSYQLTRPWALAIKGSVPPEALGVESGQTSAWHMEHSSRAARTVQAERERLGVAENGDS